jgi:hypothetical protein
LDKRLHNKASDVSSEGGQVMVDGPDGVVVALTPDAAEETARKLLKQARKAGDADGAEAGEELLPDDLDDKGNFA